MKNRKKKHIKGCLIALLLGWILLLPGCAQPSDTPQDTTAVADDSSFENGDQTETNIDNNETEDTLGNETSDISSGQSIDIPGYSGEPYITIDDNIPSFEDSELTTDSFEDYAALDELGRCGTAYACIGTDLMPTEERESISSVTPTGWVNNEYDSVDGGYLYNRCHLIGFQLSGENANERNLITGTRYLNIEGMLPFENMVADYVKETGNHVMYRVTPVFEGDNLLASGVELEALSVEDQGEGISFHVYSYNVQPGIEIDYATGENWASTDAKEPSEDVVEGTYILNTNSRKFHLPSCSSVGTMSEKNKEEYTGSREKLIEEGYEPCKNCNP